MKMVSKKVEKSQLKDEEVDGRIQLIEKNISSLKVSLICSYVFTIVVALFLICFMKSEIETNVQRVLSENQANPSKSDSPKYHQYSKNVNNEHFERKSSNFMNDQDEPEVRAKRETLNKEPAANDSHVEFFDPKMRSELEKRDAEIMKRTGAKGGAPNGDTWVWLTAYSRLPYDAITGFCKATKEYCPPGPSGLPGVQGPKGIKGDLGTLGPKGMDGKIGKVGRQGPKGEEGIGKPGLDGRDGMNGEPGLDGVPGRAGIDGIPGTKGKDGINAVDGKDGKDGAVGPVGPPGIIGHQGPRGLTGPRGRVGKPGKDGSNGHPGVSLWTVNVNGSASNDYLIPPSIATAGLQSYEKIKPIVVYEGDNLRLRCATIGFPPPMVEWVREDTRTINSGAWEANSLTGHTLNITKINRVHMGTYKCISNNGIPPTAKQNFQIDVHFSPWVHVKNQVIYVDEGSSIILECEVEAFPEPVRYWEKVPDRSVIEANEQDKKYIIESTSSDTYKFTMRLNVTNLKMQDYGEYNCIAKNEMGIAKGVFYLQNNDNSIIRPLKEGSHPMTFGKNRPEKQSYEEICGAPTTCPECLNPKDFKCKDTIFSLYDLVGGDLEIKPTGNISYPGFPNRTLDCVLHAVGRPVFHNHLELVFGAWMKDANANKDNEKIWLTKEGEYSQLYEFNSKVNYRKNAPSKVYRLPHQFKGNAHVVYNGSFYYYRRDETKIVKYDLALEKLSVMKEIEHVNNTNYLYSTEVNVVDFNVDDNGLWIIYSTPVSNHTIVSKLHENTLEVQYSWNISVNHHKVGEMFIVCGVLYAIDSVTELKTKIRLALDLVEGKLLDVTLEFTNPFKKTTTVGYNHRDMELYTWDGGNQLTYPVRYHDMGYNLTIGEKNDGMMNPLTGFDVFRRNKKTPSN